MEKIAIINLKGGVGKSVTTINLAAEFSARGLQVLVVDLDKQANTTKFYNALDYDKPSTADILTCAHGIAYTMQVTDTQKVNLVPANMRLLAANKQVLLDTTEPQQIRLRDALEQVQDLFDICLMDCPPDLDMGSINALCAADWVIIPVDCDEWATDGLREVLDQMNKLRMYYNPRLKLMGVLLTKYNRTNAEKQVVKDVAELGVLVMKSMIRYTVKVKEARSAHKALRDYAPGGTATQDYADLADEVLDVLGLDVSNVDTQKDGAH
ncbi:ParA family protein [Gemmiger formicilis]|uniref:ParA family protein n=1 Tax=Gemmiger formicilis TaxID=745368 RepID=UPI001958688A|nr:ParA family protein [Gemmiger formicilis]MBM6898278.1 ParA family protein [Gemmiger formicilis]